MNDEKVDMQNQLRWGVANDVGYAACEECEEYEEYEEYEAYEV